MGTSGQLPGVVFKLDTTPFVGGTPRNVAFAPSGETALVTTEEAVVFIR